jgi:hypothetical protein
MSISIVPRTDVTSDPFQRIASGRPLLGSRAMLMTTPHFGHWCTVPWSVSSACIETWQTGHGLGGSKQEGGRMNDRVRHGSFKSQLRASTEPGKPQPRLKPLKLARGTPTASVPALSRRPSLYLNPFDANQHAGSDAVDHFIGRPWRCRWASSREPPRRLPPASCTRGSIRAAAGALIQRKSF